MTWVPSQFIESWALSVLSSIERNSWDQVPGTWFGVEEIQKILIGTRRVSHSVLLI